MSFVFEHLATRAAMLFTVSGSLGTGGMDVYVCVNPKIACVCVCRPCGETDKTVNSVGGAQRSYAFSAEARSDQHSVPIRSDETRLT